LDFFQLAEHVAETLDIGPGTRVFEVDCGDGAFLVPFHQNGFIVGGSDGDADAIRKATAAMPGGVFQTGRAAALDPAIPWDVVVCRSFGAPHDLSTVAVAEVDYLRGLLARMFAKATHAIAVMNLPDDRRKWILHALAEIGANAIQFETAAKETNTVNVFARV